MDYHKIASDLTRDEGVRLKPYQDTVGKTTIGVGRNLDDKGITHAEATMMLHADIEDCVQHALEVFPAFKNLPEPAQRVVVNMIFQLGAAGFRGFGRFITAVRCHAWHSAADEALDSRAAHQAPERFKRHADTLRSLAPK